MIHLAQTQIVDAADVLLCVVKHNGFEVKQRINSLLRKSVLRFGGLSPKLVAPLGYADGECHVRRHHADCDQAERPVVVDEEVRGDNGHLQHDRCNLKSEIAQQVRKRRRASVYSAEHSSRLAGQVEAQR
jgi:hypothetical protein